MRRVLLGLAALVLATASMLYTHAASAAEVDIDFANGAFTPNPATATAGDDVGFCNGSNADIVVHFTTGNFGESDPIPPNKCEVLSTTTDEAGTYDFECKSCSNPKPTGKLTLNQPPPTTTTSTVSTTTTAPAVTTTTVHATTTTAKRTTTTAKRTTTTRRTSGFQKTTVTKPPATTTTSEETTTSTEFETTTSEETTTTSGGFAINTSGKKDNGSTYALLGSLAIIVGGGGYLLWRFRYRFIR